MQNYPGNGKTARPAATERSSREAKPEQEKPKVEKVITGDVIRRKKSLGKRFRETFIGGEDARGVMQYVTFEVLAPAAKDMVADAVSQGVERLIFGEARSASRRTGVRPGSGSYVSYNKIRSGLVRNDPREDPRPQLSRQARRNHIFDEIVLATRAEGNEVLDKLFVLVDQYESASVSDLYELVGITGDYTDEKWGWTDLRGATILRVNDGYLLDLPPTVPLT